MEGVDGVILNGANYKNPESDSRPDSRSSGGEGMPPEYYNSSAIQYVPPGGGMFYRSQPPNANQDTYTAFFNPNAKPVPSPTPLPSGTFVAIVELGIIMHIHTNGTVCTNLIEHATLALQSDVQGARAARQTLAEHFQNKVLSRIRELESQNDKLEQQADKHDPQLERVRRERKEAQQQVEELQVRVAELEKSLLSANVAPKRKSPDAEQVEPPAKRAATQPPSSNTLNRTAPVVPRIGLDIIDPEARIDPNYDSILIEYSQYRPGYPRRHIAHLRFHVKNGGFLIPSHIVRHSKSNTIPTPIALSGTMSGAQSFPASSEELQQLVARSQLPGEFDALIKLRYIRGLAHLLRYIHTKAPDRVPDLSGVAMNCLNVPNNPEWARHTMYHDYERAISATDSAEHWTNNPVQLPRFTSVPRTTEDPTTIADEAFVHFEFRRHLGVMVTDNGYIYTPSVLADILYRDLSPVVPRTDTGSVPDFRTHFITLAANVGMYQDILVDGRIEVAASRHIQRCRPSDVTSPTSLAIHLAEKCGITVEEMEKYLPFALKYCEDVCRSMNHSPQTRYKYARIFVNAQHHLLFFPFPEPVRDTYRVNSEWNFPQIIEYHRRQFVLRHWKEHNDPRLPSPDFDIPKMQYEPYPLPAHTIQGVADIHMSDGDNVNQPPPAQSNNGLNA
ncbi:hypothetical protein AAF712_010189 [Marasmius tenuissimus]|uniref:Uncharacterized protein n=1 Tax=Marasmius tenuissimus TaxID=585030 RepID=A0ABR2ZMN2_9AGAR